MGLVVICLAVGTAVPTTAADPAFNHRCRWWNDWCNKEKDRGLKEGQDRH